MVETEKKYSKREETAGHYYPQVRSRFYNKKKKKKRLIYPNDANMRTHTCKSGRRKDTGKHKRKHKKSKLLHFLEFALMLTSTSFRRDPR